MLCGYTHYRALEIKSKPSTHVTKSISPHYHSIIHTKVSNFTAIRSTNSVPVSDRTDICSLKDWCSNSIASLQIFFIPNTSPHYQQFASYMKIQYLNTYIYITTSPNPHPTHINARLHYTNKALANRTVQYNHYIWS